MLYNGNYVCMVEKMRRSVTEPGIEGSRDSSECNSLCLRERHDRGELSVKEDVVHEGEDVQVTTTFYRYEVLGAEDANSSNEGLRYYVNHIADKLHQLVSFA